jgi:hypothetical protein
VAVIDSDTTQARSTAARAGQLDIVRRMSLGIALALLVQYALGMVVNLYVTVPARDHGGGILTAVGRAFSAGPAAVAIHAGLGLLLIAGGINLVIRSARSRHRALIWLSAVSLLSILGAAVSGAGFVNSGADGASLAMALLTGAALACSALSLYVLSPAPRPR